MNGLAVLDLGIGLALVYLLLALICMALMEWVSQLRKRRGRTLVDSLPRLFGEEASTERPITTALLQHPLIKPLGGQGRPPSYLSSQTFAAALHDVLSSEAGPSAHLTTSLRALSRDRGEDLDRTAVAAWFDQYMDRVSGGFMRNTRKWILAISAVLTLALNADSLTLIKTLWNDPTMRAYLVERAKTRLEQGPPMQTVEYTDPLSAQVTPPVAAEGQRSPDRLLTEESDLIGSLFGWQHETLAIAAFEATYGRGIRGWTVWLVVRLVGWAMTILAISLGAPFWFDTLKRLTSLRSAGAVPAKAKEAEHA